ncbi:MAG TPA: putative LPS assembly protein LptD [Flavisolibacter sp.]|nr:putative LPS assembly protein LptD [Flavisolibacter sp.]
MRKLDKFNLKSTCFPVIATIFCIAITYKGEASIFQKNKFFSTLTSDTVPQKNTPRSLINNRQTRPIQNNIGSADTIRPLNQKDTTLTGDTLTEQRIDTFSLKLSKDTLDAPVEYEAEDSAVLFVKEQRFILYGKTKTTYKDIVLTAPKVNMDQKRNILIASGEKDNHGNVITRAVFTQGEQRFQSDSIEFNFKTQRGLTHNTYTQQGEFFIKAGVSKKVDAKTVFIKEGFYTTCNLDHPHFAFKTNKLKVISNEIAVSGPTHPEFEGVPIPIYLPFGIFPLKQGRHSGLLAPQFTATEQFGLGLEGLGYYHVLNDYYDVTVRTNLYSYGGWSANITPTYRKRYRYNGSFNLSLQRVKMAFKGDPDFNLTKTFAISWSHNVDQRARPGTSFSASVNAGSSKHNQFVTNNAYRNFQNQLYSSVSYAKQWKGSSLQLSANHNQNNSTGLYYITLPDAGYTVTTLYPFQRKEAVGTPKWYEKFGVGYSGVLRNQLAFYDTAAFTARNILDTLQWGARHSFPINMPLPPIAGKFFVSPSIAYEETWLTKRYGRQWNAQLNKVDTITVDKGLYIDRQMSFGLGVNTNIYGTVPFKNSRIIAIRHVMRPTLSASYRPNLSKRFYDVIEVNSAGQRQPIPQFQGNLFSGYGFGRFGGMSFGVDNNLEMKWRSKKDTGTAAIKKVRLIDGFGFQSAYNFLKDSQKLEPFNVYLRSTLFEKISLTAQALLDPYDVGPTGLSVDRFVWQGDRFRIGNVRYGSIAASTSFQSKPRDPQQAARTNQGRTITDPSLLAEQQSLVEYMQRNPAEFVDFNIPWSVSLSYSLSFNQRIKPDYTGFDTDVSSNVSFNNSFSLTPQWNFSTNGFFDFDTKQLTMFTMSISRDLHCWQMSINATPIGRQKYFNITISPKSSILQNLRVNRTRYFYDF